MKEIPYSFGKISNAVIGKITRNIWENNRSKHILITQKQSILAKGFAAVICTEKNNKKRKTGNNWIYLDKDVSDLLVDNDCLYIGNDGIVKILWETASNSNSILLTESCNCNCIMCPQPPKRHNPELYKISKRLVEIIEPKHDQTICLTGGEPTLLGTDFLTLLDIIKNRHPNTHALLLTNGKNFADENFAKLYASNKPPLLTTCISLHADTEDIHDMIVQSQGSFYKTLKGLYNLGKFNDRIELRVVINKQNYKRIKPISEFIYKNLPFVYHCAFMGQEITGLALQNRDLIWIDPYHFRNQLSDAINILSRSDMNVSIYNIPFCLLNSDTWFFARQSISGWKNTYIDICSECKLKKFCTGLFSTSGDHQSQYIQPIQ
jgi:His-Xaa-Ser system radical SAM maturase HxsC